ncbi:MAG: alpha-ketoglutarate-dependent dioxygenase AlkB [Myxococcota bacterium]
MRWCARCRDPELRRRSGQREPLALPDWLVEALATEGAPGLHGFDPVRQCAPSCPAFRGVRVYPNAVTEAEAERLLGHIEARPFAPSQSGKQKQHFGPRFNFLRRRMNAERFAGLPEHAGWLEARLRALVAEDRAGDPVDLADARRALDTYRTTDVFVLRYDEEERSNLDFHVDDLFAYGEAILDLSLGSDSVLSFLGPFEPAAPASPSACVRVPLPARSLAVVYGAARFDWQHAILPQDVRGVRTSITLRTLAPALRETEAGRVVLARATGAPID